jgi:tripartite-type tricarboxylate transporter receptor subunit TctC
VLAVSFAAVGGAAAQTYPAHPIRWIIGFPPAGPTDILVRIMGDWLGTRLGQPVIVENKPGAASNIATEAVINAAPDGYVIGSVTSANAINATVNKRTLQFDYLKQLIPVSGMSQGPSVLVVNPSIPASNIAELIAYAKANPGKINFGSPGIGSTGHLAAELFKAMAGVDLVHVPYRGAAPAMADLMAGHVQVVFDSMVSVLPHVQGGRVRALAVTSKARSSLLPDLPTIAETLPGYESTIWFGVGAPRGTPPEIVARLNREINAGLAAAEIKEKYAKLGTTPMVMTPEEFWAFAQGETDKWREVIERAGIKAD